MDDGTVDQQLSDGKELVALRINHGGPRNADRGGDIAARQGRCGDGRTNAGMPPHPTVAGPQGIYRVILGGDVHRVAEHQW